MNTIAEIASGSRSVLWAACFGLFAFFAVAALPSPAHAQFIDDFGGGYGDGGGCCDFYGSAYDTATIDYSYYDTATPDFTYYDTATPDFGYYDTYTPDTYTTYDTYYPDTYTTYDTYYPSSYAASANAYLSAYASYIPSYSYPSYSAPSRSSVYAPSSVFAPTTVANNGNSCTAGNSCNTTISSPTTVSYNNAVPAAYPVYYPQPTYYPQPPVYQNPAPTCYLTVSPGYASPGQAVNLSWSATNATYGTISNIGAVMMSGSRTVYPYGNTTYVGSFTGPGGSTNCYATVNLSQAQVPYVTLSQVPYTGLDLGPAGTALYFLILLLGCAVAAYAVAVQKLPSRFMSGFKKFLLGDETAPRHPAYQARTLVPAAASTAPIAPAKTRDAIDSFIAAQIARAK